MSSTVYPQKPYIKVPTPRNSECDLMWTRTLQRTNPGYMKPSGRDLTQCDWYPYVREKSGHEENINQGMMRRNWPPTNMERSLECLLPHGPTSSDLQHPQLFRGQLAWKTPLPLYVGVSNNNSLLCMAPCTTSDWSQDQDTGHRGTRDTSKL